MGGAAPGGTFTEPCQCCAHDCRFIAAMSSTLWMGKPLSIKIEAIGTPNKYSIMFYDASGPKTVYIDDYLYCDSNKQLKWAYDRKNILDIWPGLFEKAYAAACENISNVLSNPVSKPIWPCSDPSKPAFGSGFVDSNGQTNNRLINCSAYTVAATSAKLVQICGSPGKTSYPTIAFTKLSGAPSFLKNDHAYSVLGLYPDKSKFSDVVLRNPKCGGSTPGGPTTWKSLNSLPLNSGDGIITVNKTDFDNYFSSIQYCII
jgi:hypothetical protein